MAFRVEISRQAFTDLDDIAEYIKQQGSFDRAEAWFNGIIAAIRTLEDSPSRCPVADESEDLEQEVHVLLYGKRNRKYRVYYSIQHKTPSKGKVSVFHVRHWARKSLSPDQLRELKSGRNK
jgi:plasmid stabilization system protein ParE